MTTARDVIADRLLKLFPISKDEAALVAFGIESDLLSADESVRLELARKLNPPRPADEYHEDMGDVLWWELPVSEPPYVGGPNDLGYAVEVTVTTNEGRPQMIREYVGGWPDRHTHFTKIPLPAPPESETKE